MNLPADYLTYARRQPGPDHSRYAHRDLAKMAPVEWPDGNRLLIWITIHVEHFPMDMPNKPFVPIGGMDRPPPSVWDYSTRDYGNRVGIYRLMRVLDRHGLRATVATNSTVAERYPYLLEQMLKRHWDIAASGVDMGKLHHGLLSQDQERDYVEESFATLRRLSGQPVVGWHSPAHSQSQHTPELVAGAGARYIADWINDDMPYAFSTAEGELIQLPLSYELSDRKIIFLHNQSVDDYAAQINAAFDCLYAEAGQKGGRLLSLSLSPWVIAQPSRIRALDRLLARFVSYDKVAGATGEMICDAWEGAAGRGGAMAG